MKNVIPFVVEYAKSNRVVCQGCELNIAKDALRMGIMLQNPAFDCQLPNWFHYECFWRNSEAEQLKSVDEIESFGNLRWADQVKIRQRIQEKSAATSRQDGPQYKSNVFQADLRKNAGCRLIGGCVDSNRSMYIGIFSVVLCIIICWALWVMVEGCNE